MPWSRFGKTKEVSHTCLQWCRSVIVEVFASMSVGIDRHPLWHILKPNLRIHLDRNALDLVAISPLVILAIDCPRFRDRTRPSHFYWMRGSDRHVNKKTNEVVWRRGDYVRDGFHLWGTKARGNSFDILRRSFDGLERSRASPQLAREALDPLLLASLRTSKNHQRIAKQWRVALPLCISVLLRCFSHYFYCPSACT